MSQHIDPTPKQTDITSLNSNIATHIGQNYVGTGFTISCSHSEISARQISILAIGANDVIIITLHTGNYGAYSIKKNTAFQTTISNDDITVTGLDYARYFFLIPQLGVVKSITPVS